VEDRFDGPDLDRSVWLPYHLPQWSSRAQSAARYRTGPEGLTLRIDEDQPPWCPELDGGTRVSSLQTGVFSGPVGSTIGQHRFSPEAVVREEQPASWLLTPRYGRIEVELRALDDPECMVALWMIGIEDVPEHSAEICVAEIFGRDVEPRGAGVGMGVHPFGDPRISDAWAREDLPIDARELHRYAVDWRPDRVEFAVDGEHVKTVRQSLDYPMQLMLGIYEFPADGRRPPYPKELRVRAVRVEPA